MKATITKLQYPVVVIIGEGDDQVVVFARTMFQANEIARAHGATDVEAKDYQECLSFTHGLDLQQPSSTGGTDSGDPKAGTKSQK
jgi:hypothetical protein